MLNGNTFLAIITARGGSKGLPEKNIRELRGKPLITWTLESVKKSKYIDRCFISTDSRKIAEVCKKEGFEIPELRPRELAEDNSSSVDVVAYTIDYLKREGEKYDYFILLEPTSPLRADEDIDKMIQLTVKNPEKNGVISVGRIHMEHPAIVKRINSEGCIVPYGSTQSMIYQRQQEDEAYFPYGVGYLIKISEFEKYKSIYLENIVPYIIERWQNYEIDDIYDFYCVEKIMEMRGL